MRSIARCSAWTPAAITTPILLLHVINVLLLFWVLRRATGCIGRSAMVAALFALASDQR